MGKKGAKLTAVAGEAAATLVQSLQPLGDVSSKKMFGGHGIFAGGKMFALIDSSGGVFFKADDANRAQFEAAGSEQHGRMPYFAVPGAVLADEAELHKWALMSMAIARQ